jgi:hypothetical protein
MAHNKKTYPKGHLLHEPQKPASTLTQKHIETSQISDVSTERVRLSLSISRETDDIFSAASECLGVTKTTLVTSLLIQALPALRSQVDAVRSIKS